MIKEGYYSIDDIKSFFHKEIEEKDDYSDDIEEGEIMEMRVREFPPLDIVFEVILVQDNVLVSEVLEVIGNSDEYFEGDVIFIPIESL